MGFNFSILKKEEENKGVMCFCSFVSDLFMYLLSKQQFEVGSLMQLISFSDIFTQYTYRLLASQTCVLFVDTFKLSHLLLQKTNTN